MDEAEHTCKQVARIVGVADSTISSWYRGASLPYDRNTKGIMRYLGGQKPPAQQSLPLSNGKLSIKRAKDTGLNVSDDVFIVKEGQRIGLAKVQWL